MAIETRGVCAQWDPATGSLTIWAGKLAGHRARAANRDALVVEGVLNRMVGMTLEAIGCEAADQKRRRASDRRRR